MGRHKTPQAITRWANIMDAIATENERSWEMDGEQNVGDYEWMTNLTEGLGSIATDLRTDASWFAVRGDVIWLAAKAIEWLECMARREANDRPTIPISEYVKRTMGQVLTEETIPFDPRNDLLTPATQELLDAMEDYLDEDDEPETDEDCECEEDVSGEKRLSTLVYISLYFKDAESIEFRGDDTAFVGTSSGMTYRIFAKQRDELDIFCRNRSGGYDFVFTHTFNSDKSLAR